MTVATSSRDRNNAVVNAWSLLGALRNINPPCGGRGAQTKVVMGDDKYLKGARVSYRFLPARTRSIN